MPWLWNACTEKTDSGEAGAEELGHIRKAAKGYMMWLPDFIAIRGLSVMEVQWTWGQRAARAAAFDRRLSAWAVLTSW